MAPLNEILFWEKKSMDADPTQASETSEHEMTVLRVDKLVVRHGMVIEKGANQR